MKNEVRLSTNENVVVTNCIVFIQCNVFELRSYIFVYTIYNRKKLQFITLLTAICIVSHIENSKNDKGYVT